MGLKITAADQDDISTIVTILTEATEHKAAHSDMAWGTGAFTNEEVAEYMVTHPMYIVKINTEAVGTFSITWEDTHIWGKQELDAGYIHRLAVRHGFHSKDLGEAIINWAAAETKKQGRTLLRLDCPLDNKKLRAYYEKTRLHTNRHRQNRPSRWLHTGPLRTQNLDK